MTAQCDHGCGKPHTVTDEGSSFGHSYGEWISNGDGTHTKTCANDATHKVIESCHGGSATCTTKAICDDCNAEYGELGHSFTNYESNNDATCEVDGTKTATCDHGCGEHDTITDEGTAKGHTYGAWISNGDETHTKTCANDSTHTVTESCHGGEATCTERAICDDCKAEYGGVKHIVDNSGWCTICDLSVSATKGVEYAISDDNTYVSVVGYNGSSTRVRIADSYSGLPVIAINSGAFKLTAITEVIIPSSVTSIGNSAFFVCSSLTAVYISDIAAWCNISFENAYSNPLLYAKNLYLNNELVTDLVIPDSVTSIGSYAFGSCDSLTNVTIPDSVTSIGDNAFGSCDSLTNVTIPDSVTNIGRSVFSTCYNLTYNEYDNAYYLGNSENPYVVLVEAKLESIKACTINENTKVICDSAFYGCSNLTSITIPSRVTSIGDKAFYECSNLTSVSIGNSVTSIGSYAFYNCSRLSKVTIPDSVTSIEYGAFYNCGSLTSITIGNGVKSIAQDAFSACSKLTSVYYKGSESEWKEISIDNSNNDLTSATKYYYSESNPFEGENAVESGKYWHYDTDGKTILVWVKQ